ncbi:hypothetical protein B0H11DRAFT_1924704 [Mycena galericulata]|nr:hypothetical protein B0H11DRAFT_1924704 [Mycena galericulata]
MSSSIEPYYTVFYSSPSRKWVELWQVQTVQRLWSWGRQGQNLRVEGATFDIPQDGFLAVVCMNVSDGQTGDHVIIVEANFQTGGSRDLGRFHLPDGVRFDGCADTTFPLVRGVPSSTIFALTGLNYRSPHRIRTRYNPSVRILVVW